MLLPSHQRQSQSCAFAGEGDGSQPLSHPVTVISNGGQDGPSLGPAVPSHPFGIKPLGNKYFSSGGKDARGSLGVLQILPDEMLMQLLEYLDAHTLRLFGYTCKFLFACCMADDVWKAIFLE